MSIGFELPNGLSSRPKLGVCDCEDCDEKPPSFDEPPNDELLLLNPPLYEPPD